MLLQFRPGGPIYDENDIGWVFRNGKKFTCLAREVRVGDLLPNCDIYDEVDRSIRVLVPVTEILNIQSTSEDAGSTSREVDPGFWPTGGDR